MFKMRFKTKFYIFLYALIAVAAIVGVLAGMGVFDAPCTHPNSEIETIVGKKATCLNGGISDGKKCKACGEIIVQQEALPKIPHTERILAAVPATCATEGKTEGKKCTECETVLVEQQTLAKLDHTPVDSPEVLPTCTESGSVGGTHCSVCYQVLSMPVITAPTGHTWVEVGAVEATCATEGHTGCTECSVCHEKTGEYEIIPKTDCLEEDIIILEAVAATCSHTGWTEGRECSRCHTVHVAQERTEATGDHEYDYANPYTAAIAADCDAETDGLTESYKCLYCDHILEAEIVKWAHTHGAWTREIEATDTCAGAEFTFCTECGEYIERSIPMVTPTLPPEATEEEREDKFNKDNDIDPDGIV